MQVVVTSVCVAIPLSAFAKSHLRSTKYEMCVGRIRATVAGT